MSLDHHEQYIIRHKIGEGGMGTVYLAEDVLLQRLVAIKALNNPQGLSQGQMEERFQQEALALARLNHSNITHLYAFIPRQQTYWMVMEYVEGKTLEEWLHMQGTIDALTSCSIIAQVLDGLEHAHRKGIIHRDLKPANIMVSSEGEVKIMDFGIARIRNSQRLTQHGKSVGTLEYMAPEQIQGKEGDELTDIYATANMLYEMLAGTPPFKSDTDYLLMKAKLNERPPVTPSLTAHAGKKLLNVVLKAMETNPSRRYTNVRTFREALLSAIPQSTLHTGHSLQEALQTGRPGDPPPNSNKSPLIRIPALPVNKAVLLRKKDALFSLLGRTDKSVKLLAGVAALCAALIIWNTFRMEKNASISAVNDKTNEQETTYDEKESAATTTGIIEAQLIQNNRPSYAPIAYIADSSTTSNDTLAAKPVKKETPKNTAPEKKEPAPKEKAALPKEKNIKDTPEESEATPVQQTTPENGKSSGTENTPRRSMVQIPRGTTISLVLQEPVSSEEKSKDGKLIQLSCAADVVVNGEVVVHKGAEAIGKIVDVEPSAKRRKGLVGFVILKVKGRDGKDIRVESQRFRLRSDEVNEPAVYHAGKSFNALLKKGTVVK